MRILFFKACKGSFADKWMAWWSNGKYSRIQIEFVDGVRFGVDIHRARAVLNPFPFTPENWDSLDIPGAEDVIRSFCEAYDGVWLPLWVWFFPFYKSQLVRKFSSVLAAQAFANADYTGLPANLTPNSFRTWLDTWLINNPVPPPPPFPKPCPPFPPVPSPTPPPSPPEPPCPPTPPQPTPPPCPPNPPVPPCPPPYKGFWRKRKFFEILTWE